MKSLFKPFPSLLFNNRFVWAAEAPESNPPSMEKTSDRLNIPADSNSAVTQAEDAGNEMMASAKETLKAPLPFDRAKSLNGLARKNKAIFKMMLKKLEKDGFDVGPWKKSDRPIDLKEVYGNQVKELPPFDAENLNSFARKGKLAWGMSIYEMRGYDVSAWEGREGPIDLKEAGFE